MHPGIAGINAGRQKEIEANKRHMAEMLMDKEFAKVYSKAWNGIDVLEINDGER